MARKLLPFGAAIFLAFLVVAISRLADLGAGATYALAGFTAGVLVVAGTLFAFERLNRVRVQDADRVKSDIPAVVADGDERGQGLVVHMRVDEGLLVRGNPAIATAGGAVASDVLRVEPSSEAFEIGHNGAP